MACLSHQWQRRRWCVHRRAEAGHAGAGGVQRRGWKARHCLHLPTTWYRTHDAHPPMPHPCQWWCQLAAAEWDWKRKVPSCLTLCGLNVHARARVRPVGQHVLDGVLVPGRAGGAGCMSGTQAGPRHATQDAHCNRHRQSQKVVALLPSTYCCSMTHLQHPWPPTSSLIHVRCNGKGASLRPPPSIHSRPVTWSSEPRGVCKARHHKQRPMHALQCG